MISSDNVGFKIYLHTEVYGYEELLCGLAQEEIKIRLNELQKVQFDHCELGEWFQFDGTPQIEVCVSVSAEHPFTQSDYELVIMLANLSGVNDNSANIFLGNSITME